MSSLFTCFFQRSAGLALFMLMTLAATLAHEGRLVGTLTDAQSGTPVVRAEVDCPELSLRTFSDEWGQFSLEDLPAGTHILRVRRLGYEPVSREFTIDSTETARLEWALTPRFIQINEVQISAKKRPDQPFETIQALDLQLRPQLSAQDALRAVPGLFIAQHAGGGKAEQIFLRGFDIDHGTDIQLTVDGMPVNMVSHAHGQGYSDLHFLIPETIEAVDFAKGPYQAERGNFTTAGFAAFQTRDVLEQSLFKLEGGQFGTLRGVGMIDLLPNSRRHHAYVASEYLFSDGYFESPQGFNRFNVMGKYQGQVGEKHLLSISASAFQSAWDASGQIPVRAVEQGLISRFGAIDDTEGGETRRQNLNLQWTQGIGRNALIKHQVFYSHYDFTLFSNFTFFLEDAANGDQIRQSESRDIYGYNGSYQREYTLGGMRMQTTAGLQARIDEVQANELSRTRNRSELLERLAYGDVQEQNIGAFVSQNWWINRFLSANFGLRYDYFRFAYEDRLSEAYDPQALGKGILSPKANLMITPSSQLQFYLSAGSGFHSNDTRTIVAEQSDAILPRAYSADVGAIFKPFKGLLVQTAVWGLDLEQEFVYVGDAGIVEPSGASRRYGADVSLRYQASPWLYLDTDLTYTRARSREDESGENFIPLAPAWTSIGGATVRLKNGLEGSLRYRFLGDRPANEDYSLTAEGYWLLDLSVRYRFRDITLFATLENLADVAWREAQFETTSRLRGEDAPVSEIHFTPGSPRFLRAGISYQF